MTTSGRSSSSAFSPRRRSLLIGTASTAVLATLGTGTAAAAGTRPAAADAFDFDTGNFHRDLLSAPGNPSDEPIGPMDASVLIYLTHLTMAAWFDALAPYHRTAVGVYSRIARRPTSESATNRNRNVAALHAGYRVIKNTFTERAPAYRQLMISLGLNPDDESMNPATPVGIGNRAAQAVLRARARDGMNRLGDEHRRYNGRPYEDYTGYEPVNSAYKLVNPSRWQPQAGPHRRRVGGGPGDKGIFVIQKFATPQLALVKADTYKDPGQFELAPPDHTDHTRPGRYKRSVDEMLAASAGLTDEHKTKAEFFDNKFLGIGQSTKAAAEAHDLDLDDWIHLHYTSSMAQLDDLIAAWHFKRKYDAVRPVSAIRHVYGTAEVTAWGGVGKGTVHDIPADEWASFIPVGDHPEYPSGSTTLCAAEAQAARRFLGDDVLNWTYKVAAGSSLTEPGLTPAKDIELHFATWSEFEKNCAMSRVWAGVHFPTTVERSLKFGRQFGDRAYELVQRYVKGEVEDRP
ncbi:vanadium-dependent haloperoxidase [Streptomyces broussonetiae]|uniref:vanadium-dependent haloperoxidase n=1 Tax=Streptomyces broussonetiae TaxID=2686304 RepID=UPI0035DA8A99